MLRIPFIKPAPLNKISGDIFPFFFLVSIFVLSCQSKNKTPSKEVIAAINLKRGELKLCGVPDRQFGMVEFTTSCSEKTKIDFDLAIALLHSFEYDEAEKVFAKIIDEYPDCAMAYWGVAMCNYHQVWPSPPSQEELEKGQGAVLIAQSIIGKSKRETAYIDAIAQFYKDWNTLNHRTRSVLFEKAMENIYKTFPEDKEAAVFYALSLVGAADPADKSYGNQRKAGSILTALYPGEANHPGIVHYIIHTYDYPELAELALPAARKYAAIAPASAHAQHMPSHIYTRLGLWAECIESNRVSTTVAKCYAAKAGFDGHWDEELHGMDYLVYAYLQRGENDLAREQYEYLKTIHRVYPVNFKDAYAFAAIPSRYFLENKMWNEAASLQLHPQHFPWDKFPWQKAIFHFTRLLGNVHTDRIEAARTELKNLHALYDTLQSKDPYKANQVLIQMKAGEAWILLKEGKTKEAELLMSEAAEMEDKTDKSPVTPGEVLPARELLADMYFELKRPADALPAYEADLKNHPNRFNGLYGAALASEKIQNAEKAKYYYSQLLYIADSTGAKRHELETARLFLK